MGKIQLEMWPAIIFGWPAILGAIALSATGIIHGRPKLLIVGAVISLPFSFYLAGSPVFGWLGFIMPSSLVASAIASYHHHSGIAWSLFAPFVAVSGWLALLVLSQ